jgi:SWIM zinc finger
MAQASTTSKPITLEVLASGEVVARSQSRKGSYRISLAAPFCECPDFQYRASKAGRDCKHLRAARIVAGQVPKSGEAA